MRLRPAREGDVQQFWVWANDPEARSQAFHSETVPWETHAAWYRAKLADPHCFMAILEASDGTPIGQIRFDEGPVGLEVDLSVSVPHRGQGVGQRLLTEGLAAVAERWPAGTTIVAKVLRSNPRSLALFTRCGFVSKGIRMLQGRAFHQLERALA